MDKIIITCPVLIPFTPDCEYSYGEEVLPPEKIEQLANSFNDYKIIDLQHEFTKRLINKLNPIPRGKLLKSYIVQDTLHLKGLDGLIREYPKGTWIISVEITDPEAKQLYKEGVLTGLSVTVKEREHADAIIDFLENNSVPYLPEQVVEAEKAFSKVPKRILMKDVVNPVAFTVSLVRAPCVYDAKFCKNSCLIVNKNKLREKKILNLKEKIKKELNSFIDGLDVEDESVKEDIESSEPVEVLKEDVEDASEAVKTEENSNVSEQSESIKEDGDGDGDGKGDGDGNGGTSTPATPSSDGNGNGGTTPTSTDANGGTTPTSTGGDGDKTSDTDSTTSTSTDGGESDDDSDEDNSTSKGKVKKEAKKEDLETESEKSESKKCGGTKTIYGRKVKVSEAKKETEEDAVATESDKVLYLAQEDVESLISTTLRRYADEVEQMVFDGIQEALDDYLFANDTSYKEDLKSEPEEEEPEEPEEVESQKEYATAEMVQSMFDEQFSSFKSSLMDNIKQAQKESIKSYSKAITQSDDGLSDESAKESFTPRVQRDFNGCRIRRGRN